MNFEKSIKIIKALADESRLRIVNALLEKSQFVEELATRLSLAASTVSFHLKKLELAGIVNKQKEQYYVVYSLDRKVMDSSLQDLVTFSNSEKEVQDKRIAQYQDKVLSVFLENNRLIKLPSQQKKQRIVLEYFLKTIEPNRNFTEVEINELILNFYDDYCMIRRRMIEFGMIVREKQNYRRNPDYEMGIL